MTVTLAQILAALERSTADGDPKVRISGVTHDSRRVAPGWAFVAIPGSRVDGCDYAGDAIRNAAAVIVAERPRNIDAPYVPWITVPDARRALSVISALVNGDPTKKLILVGITGTNGKTTLTYLLESIVRCAGGNPGVVGTVTYRWGEKETDAGRTTPEASELQAIFADMIREGVTHAMIEASSHGLHLYRLDGCHFDVGVFTNLSQDHLDFHRDLEDYYQAKRKLFTQLLPASSKRPVNAVVNADDLYGRRLANEIQCLPVITYGTTADCNVFPSSASLTEQGISAEVHTRSGLLLISSRLAGPFNLLNILAAVAVAEVLGIDRRAIQEGIAATDVVPGRLERIPSDRGAVFVDYAHTPEALKNVLAALNGLRRGRIVTIMGCGGDRDKTKRPLMGMEAAYGSDFVVVTSDNPRSEDPLTIIAQTVEGVRAAGYEEWPESLNGSPLRKGFYRAIPDRRDAIAWAVRNLEQDNVLLIAGKGHETYQEIGGIRYPFDDRQVVREELRALALANAERHPGRGAT
ncbi:MAG: UDP-N-acetylmuramoyl-L-alanyl-D-glutamate--2,6-diaminopimelate ligase [Desulfomonile sp.]|nr:UDP-N-acetylmuramoyl-L-alanyl-D-glutamate--2,6-diaminopimelate ligase [Desulfomonile sp.]